MTTEVTIDATYGGKPLEVLADLVAKREKFLKNETTKNAITATAINVLTSLKPETKAATKTVNSAMYRVELMPGVAGWRGGKGNHRRTAVAANGHRVAGVWPVNNMYGLKGDGHLYKITLTNPNLEPRKSKNAPRYFIMAPNMSVAVKFAEARMKRALDRERGLARMALGYAQAKVSTKPMAEKAAASVNAGKVAATAAIVKTDGGDGRFSIYIRDDLDYSIPALKRGAESLAAAMMKAANKTTAIINKLGAYRLDEQIPTPFPEVSGK